MARTVGSQGYWASVLAGGIVSLAGSIALLLSYYQSTQANNDRAVSGVLLAMLVRMGLPIASAVLMQQANSPLLAAGFMGLLTLNYLVALPIETLMSLQLLRNVDSELSNTKVSGTSVSG